MGVEHGFEKNETATMLFLKKPSLVIIIIIIIIIIIMEGENNRVQGTRAISIWKVRTQT